MISPTRFFVIDAHRPIYHGNLLDTNKSVVVFLPVEGDKTVNNLIKHIDRIEKQKKKSKTLSYLCPAIKFFENKSGLPQ